MTIVSPPAPAADGEVERTAASAHCHVDLAETPAGWVLTITVDRQAAADLTSAVTQGHRLLQTGEMSVAITPNLVPGEAFEIAAVQVIVAGEPAAPARRRPKPRL